jgi:hypothetical protein
MKRRHPLTWLDHIENGFFTSELLGLTMATCDGNCHGQGFLTWNKRSGARIRAITDGGEQLEGAFWGASGPRPGSLIRSDHYSTLEATTQDGRHVNIERLSGGSRIRTGNQTVVWNIPQSQIQSAISLTKTIDEHDDSQTELLLTNAREMIWPRSFPRSLTFECQRGTAIALKSEHLARWRVWCFNIENRVIFQDSFAD